MPRTPNDYAEAMLVMAEKQAAEGSFSLALVALRIAFQEMVKAGGCPTDNETARIAKILEDLT